MDEAFDKYSFMRDSYLQYRNNLIRGSQQDDGSLYVEDQKGEQKAAADVGSDYVD
jgi:phospholipid-binding lipoprotein MlaA